METEMRRAYTVIHSRAHAFWQGCIDLQELSTEFKIWGHSRGAASKRKRRACRNKPAAEEGAERSLLEKWLQRDACCREKPPGQRSLLEKWLQRDACSRNGGIEEKVAVKATVETSVAPYQGQEATSSPDP
ncbi:uncharacterized protein LOC110296859 [Mus caroli]|uniref:Uncharacterized protein LOC110296859 n=1 Tax=Mus caroli TaxID=10089 RepID=A0A6P5PSB4_MUSCR|nr:uncharacterized protein LOC110296859 [Mus caroli]